jgi:hypothetical protein
MRVKMILRSSILAKLNLAEPTKGTFEKRLARSLKKEFF